MNRLVMPDSATYDLVLSASSSFRGEAADAGDLSWVRRVVAGLTLDFFMGVEVCSSSHCAGSHDIQSGSWLVSRKLSIVTARSRTAFSWDPNMEAIEANTAISSSYRGLMRCRCHTQNAWRIASTCKQNTNVGHWYTQTLVHMHTLTTHTHTNAIYEVYTMIRQVQKWACIIMKQCTPIYMYDSSLVVSMLMSISWSDQSDSSHVYALWSQSSLQWVKSLWGRLTRYTNLIMYYTKG